MKRFNSLQTGKGVASEKAEKADEKVEVSIPFKREKG